ncbi:hypothetical protein LZC95_45310 [Pendulispora brunnea]|uniref:Uncharacterized protein n=1 Tax=Pendulispora brunnea TaxID=2905690 RepID=A0ABZ2K4N9_9BACT
MSELALESLRQTRPWVLVISILMFIGAGFMLLAGIGMLVAGAFVPESPSGPKAPIAMSYLGLFYLPLAVLYVFPAFKLSKYAGSISRLVASRSLSDLELSLGHQKSFWKFCGIAALLMIVVYALVAVAIVVAGAMSVMKAH